MKSKLSDYMPLAAIAAGVLLLRNKSGVSGIGATNTWRALDMIEQAGMDINQDFFTLTYDQISELVHIMKKCGYRAPDARYRAGSPARYFWYFMQRVNDRPVNGIGSILNGRGIMLYDLTRKEAMLAYQLCFAALGNDEFFRVVSEIYKANRDNTGWDAMAFICGYLVTRDAQNTVPSTNENTVWSYDFAAYLIVGELAAIEQGRKTRYQAYKEIEREMESV